MIELTIKQVVEDREPINAAYRLYVIRDDETAFYVGQSINAYNRILAHLGLDGRGNTSHIGEFIIANAPLSGTWLFQMYTVEDCRAFVLDYRATLPEENRAFYETSNNPYDIDDAELALIKILRPCLNDAMNTDARPVPDKYVNPFNRSSFNPRAAALSKLFNIK